MVDHRADVKIENEKKKNNARGRNERSDRRKREKYGTEDRMREGTSEHKSETETGSADEEATKAYSVAEATRKG